MKVAVKYVVKRLPAKVVESEGRLQHRAQLHALVRLVLELVPECWTLDDVVTLICKCEDSLPIDNDFRTACSVDEAKSGD